MKLNLNSLCNSVLKYVMNGDSKEYPEKYPEKYPIIYYIGPAAHNPSPPPPLLYRSVYYMTLFIIWVRLRC